MESLSETKLIYKKIEIGVRYIGLLEYILTIIGQEQIYPAFNLHMDSIFTINIYVTLTLLAR